LTAKPEGRDHSGVILRATLVVGLLALAAGCGARSELQAPLNLSGTWHMTMTADPPHPQPAMYEGTLSLDDVAGTLTGQIPDWSNGAHSQFTGTRVGFDVRLDRRDGPPYTDFHAVFVGVVAPDALTMSGTFMNDPTAGPFANSATGPWVATRIQ